MLGGMNSNPATGLIPMAYLVTVTWAVMHSNKRWKTLLYTILGLAGTFAVFAAAAAIWPELAGVLGTLAAIPSLLISGLIAINHMRANRRAAAPKPR